MRSFATAQDDTQDKGALRGSVYPLKLKILR